MAIFKFRLQVAGCAFITTAAILLSGSFANAQVRVELQPEAVAGGKYVRLGEIAEVEYTQDENLQLEDIFLGSAPRNNLSKILTRSQIKARLLAHGVSERELTISGADQVRVLSAPLPGTLPEGGAVVTSNAQDQENSPTADSPEVKTTPQTGISQDLQAEIERVALDLAQQHILQDIGIADAQVNVEMLRLSKLEAGMELATAVKIEHTPRRINSGSFTINFGVYDKDYKRLGGLDGFFKTEIRIPAVTTRSAIARGKVISEPEVELRLVPLNEGRQAYSSLEEVVGKRAKATLSAGTTIRTGRIEILPIVHRGQNVSVTAKVGRIKVCQRGIAQQSGAAGDVIEVKNLQSGKSYPARIFADGRLELVITQQ